MEIMPRNQGNAQRFPSLSPFDRLFDEMFFEPFAFPRSFLTETLPSIDISETETLIEVVANVPGYDANDLEVNVENGILTLRGRSNQEQEKNDKQYFRRELHTSSFERSIRLPRAVNEDEAACSLKNGVLTIRLPKKAKQDKGRTLPIDAE